MQLIRNLYISEERTYKRKIREAKLAEELEDEHSKDWILTKYLNTVPYGTYGGQTAIGVWAAAKTYFNKRASKLDAGRRPRCSPACRRRRREYSPVRYPAARQGAPQRGARRDGQAAHDHRRSRPRDAKASPLRRRTCRSTSRSAARATSSTTSRTSSTRPSRAARSRRGGLRVYTTIDLEKQEQARSAIAGRLAGIGPSSAIVTIDPKNGEILAMASSSDYGKSKFNLAAQGHRQPGLVVQDDGADDRAARAASTPNSTTYVVQAAELRRPDATGPIKVKTYDGTLRRLR